MSWIAIRQNWVRHHLLQAQSQVPSVSPIPPLQEWGSRSYSAHNLEQGKMPAPLQWLGYRIWSLSKPGCWIWTPKKESIRIYPPFLHELFRYCNSKQWWQNHLSNGNYHFYNAHFDRNKNKYLHILRISLLIIHPIEGISPIWQNTLWAKWICLILENLKGNKGNEWTFWKCNDN